MNPKNSRIADQDLKDVIDYIYSTIDENLLDNDDELYILDRDSKDFVVNFMKEIYQQVYARKPKEDVPMYNGYYQEIIDGSVDRYYLDDVIRKVELRARQRREMRKGKDNDNVYTNIPEENLDEVYTNIPDEDINAVYTSRVKHGGIIRPYRENLFSKTSKYKLHKII